MRFSLAAVLLSGLVVHGAHAQPHASEQENPSNDASRAASQEPFRMPASERKNIADNPSWTAPQKPFRIYGNTWYVGPRGLGVFLVTARTGNVLIDGGVPGNAALIEANIRSLGFELRDVKWILNSHAHSDHAGGLAQLAHDTGAQVIAGAADAALLERGGHDDPQYGDRFPFPPVHVARTVVDGERLQLGDLVLAAHSTPGHTQGNTTWTWTSCEGARCLHMVDVGSLSAPGFRLVGNPKYPDIVEAFAHSFSVVRRCLATSRSRRIPAWWISGPAWPGAGRAMPTHWWTGRDAAPTRKVHVKVSKRNWRSRGRSLLRHTSASTDGSHTAADFGHKRPCRVFVPANPCDCADGRCVQRRRLLRTRCSSNSRAVQRSRSLSGA
jgi:metallo-beta-lactamase class B